MPPSTVITITGCVGAPEFHRCCALGEALSEGHNTPPCESSALFESEWETFVVQKKEQLGGPMHKHSLPYVVLLESTSGPTTLIGGVDELKALALSKYKFTYGSEGESVDYKEVAQRELVSTFEDSGNQLVYMDVGLGGVITAAAAAASAAGKRPAPARVVFELFNDTCPKTCENFHALCTGEKGKTEAGVRLCYRGSPFHRVVPGGWVQGGDIVSGAGDGGESVFGGSFADETFSVPLDTHGVLAMAQDGAHSNASQFFVTLSPAEWMNNRAVAFGRVLSGMEVFREMSAVPMLNQRPIKECKVLDCGELSAKEAAECMVVVEDSKGGEE